MSFFSFRFSGVFFFWRGGPDVRRLDVNKKLESRDHEIITQKMPHYRMRPQKLSSCKWRRTWEDTLAFVAACCPCLKSRVVLEAATLLVGGWSFPKVLRVAWTVRGQGVAVLVVLASLLVPITRAAFL